MKKFIGVFIHKFLTAPTVRITEANDTQEAYEKIKSSFISKSGYQDWQEIDKAGNLFVFLNEGVEVDTGVFHLINDKPVLE